MTRKSVLGSAYPPDWAAISTRLRAEAGWRCVRCGHPHDPPNGFTLTIHHADMDPAHSDPDLWWFTLWPLCQRCHLSIQATVDLWRPWVMMDHSPWARVYIAGWYAYRYEGRHISRAEAEADLDRLLVLERQIVLGLDA